jgi:ssDNA-binding Zn-finger/Zn-ribbon topoisomerase 1
MYPKKKPKSDRERFLEAFNRRVGTEPEVYLRRKLAGGMPESELQKLYDALAVEIAMKAHCTAIRYAECRPRDARADSAEWHRRRAATQTIPVCPRCGGRMVRRIAQKGPNAGKAFWGCSNYPACRFTKKAEDEA